MDGGWSSSGSWPQVMVCCCTGHARALWAMSLLTWPRPSSPGVQKWLCNCRWEQIAGYACLTGMRTCLLGLERSSAHLGSSGLGPQPCFAQGRGCDSGPAGKWQRQHNHEGTNALCVHLSLQVHTCSSLSCLDRERETYRQKFTLPLDDHWHCC